MNFLVDCTDDIATIVSVIKGVYNAIKWGVPILLIIFGTLDLAKAVIAGKEDEMKAAQKLLIKRLIYAVAVFLVATIVVVVMGLVNEGNDSAWWACWNNTSAKDIG